MLQPTLASATHFVASWITGPLSNQGEKSINLYFIMVPLRKKY